MTQIAIIQRPPVLLDRGATLAKAVQWVAEAAAEGATLIVFPETFIAGYPSWIWRLAPGKDGAVMGQLHARLLASAVDIGGGDLAGLCEAARAHAVTIVCGMNECDRSRGGGTLYNSVVVIGTYERGSDNVELCLKPPSDAVDRAGLLALNPNSSGEDCLKVVLNRLVSRHAVAD